MNLSCLFRLRSPLVLGVLLWPAEGALIVQFDPIQGNGETEFSFTIQNNDSGTTYQSGLVDLDFILGGVADYISGNSLNPAYAGQTRSAIMGTWTASLLPPPSSDLDDNWVSYVDVNQDVRIVDPGGGIPWTPSGSQDLAAITLDLNDSLDLNNNGQFDPATESLVLTSTSVSAFEATLNGGSVIPGSMNTYAVLTPPVIGSVSMVEGVPPTVVEDLAAGFAVVSNEGNLTYNVRETDNDPSYLLVDIFFTNPFSSAEVDSAEIAVEVLVDGLYANPANQTTYGSESDMVSSLEVDPNVQEPPTGEVSEKWLASKDTQNIYLDHFGGGYDIWHATGTNPNQDELVLTLNLSKSLFDGNGWSQAEVEAGIDYALTADAVDSVLGTAYAGTIDVDETGRAVRATRFEAVFLSVSDLVPGQTYMVERCGSLEASDWRAHLTFTASAASEVVKLYVPEEEMGAVFFRVVGE